MQDQKQHVIISICSLIIGNQISERTGSKSEKDEPKQSIPEVPAAECANTTASAETETAVTIQPEKRQKNSLQPVIGKAIGTLLLAFLVWRIFGRRSRKSEQAE